MADRGFAFSQDFLQEFGDANATGGDDTMNLTPSQESQTSFFASGGNRQPQNGSLPTAASRPGKIALPPIGLPLAQSTQRMLGGQQPAPPAGMLGQQPRRYTPPIWGRTSSADRINPDNPPSTALLYQVKRMEADARALPHHLATITASVEALKKANLKGMVEVADYIRAHIPTNDGLTESVAALTKLIESFVPKATELMAAATAKIGSEQAESEVRLKGKLDMVLDAFARQSDQISEVAATVKGLAVKETKDACQQTEPPPPPPPVGAGAAKVCTTVVLDSQATFLQQSATAHKTSQFVQEPSVDLLLQRVPQASPVKVAAAPDPDQETMYPSPIPVRTREVQQAGLHSPCAASTPKRLAQAEQSTAQSTFIGSQFRKRRLTQERRDSPVLIPSADASKAKRNWKEFLDSSAFESSAGVEEAKPQLPNHNIKPPAGQDSSFQSSVFGAKPQLPKRNIKSPSEGQDSSFQSSIFGSKFQLPIKDKPKSKIITKSKLKVGAKPKRRSLFPSKI